MYSIGMDVGGTNSVFGLVSREGKVVCRDAVKTRDYPVFADFVSAVSERVKALAAQVGGMSQVEGFGIGAPNGNYYHGTIEYAPNLAWRGVVPVAEEFGKALGVPVTVTNDANAAALGEKRYGVAQDLDHFIMITLGTGVGSGIIIDGHLLYGANGMAGELGHVTVKRDGRLCGCGRRGCLETYCSATGIVRTAREHLATDEPSLLRNLNADDITSKDLYDAAMQGDKMALDIFNETGTILGTALADFATFCDPQAFVLFGGLMKSGDLIYKPTLAAMQANIMPVFSKTKLLVSTIDDGDAAVLGASALGWKE